MSGTTCGSPGMRPPRPGSICRHNVVSIAETTKPHRENIMDRRQFLAGTAALASGTLAKPALAQGAAEVSFFYPIAVGGPITKIIDGYAADFEKENPGIQVKPRYSGGYQESIAKGL